MFRSTSARSRAHVLPITIAAAAVVSLALFAGCAPASTSPGASSMPAAGDAVSAASSVHVVDAWVKAVDTGMTGAFAVFDNTTAVDATLVSASTEAAAMVELHEVVMVDGAMLMQPKEGGIVIPAGGTHALAPGADHIMLMGVSAPLQPGDEVVLTLTFSDGSSVEQPFTVKEFVGADEEYVGGMDDHENE